MSSLLFPSPIAVHRRPTALAALSVADRRRGGQKLKLAEPSSSPISASEKSLRSAFMEDLMGRARAGDPAGVVDSIRDMIAAGLSPGPRSFHGLVVSHVIRGDEEGAMQSLRRELSSGLRPLPETFISLVRLYASKGCGTRGLEILAAMEKVNYDIRKAWLILIEELVKYRYLDDANQVFLKGAEEGLIATAELFDLLITEDCKAGDHSNAFTVVKKMQAVGRRATTFHFNCLLSVQATCGIPEIAANTFEDMICAGKDFTKPDTESYNWLIQAYTRATSSATNPYRLEDLVELLASMVEEHKRVQPNARTYALLVEFFTKYSDMHEAIRHFRALKNFPGGTEVLYNGGHFGDPLSLYLRALCREGRILELLEALEAMSKDNQPIPSRAMILNNKYRSLVSSWIEPLNEEADVGFQIDYVARYIAEGGLTGERRRWIPDGKTGSVDPDVIGFRFLLPFETSFKDHCSEEKISYYLKLLNVLRKDGPAALGNIDEIGFRRLFYKLRRIIHQYSGCIVLPKAASKMLVSELKEELEGQGLPTDGTRPVLYQRVQKARRINRANNQPLWVPPLRDVEEIDEEMEELLSRIKLEDRNTEFWKRRFLGEDLVDLSFNSDEIEDPDVPVTVDDADTLKNPSQEGNGKRKKLKINDGVEVGDVDVVEESDPDKILLSNLNKSEEIPEVLENDDDVDWFPEDVLEAFKEMRDRKVFEVSNMYTIADAWGWTWETEVKKRKPREWSEEWEAELATKVMEKVIELGGTPSIGDCAIVFRSAIKAPRPSSFLEILGMTRKLGYTFGRPLYDEAITKCLELGEIDMAIAVVADMETAGIAAADETLDNILEAKKDAELKAQT